MIRLIALTLLALAPIATPTQAPRNVGVITRAGVDDKTAYRYMDTLIAERMSVVAAQYPVIPIRNRFRTLVRQVNTRAIVLMPEGSFFNGETIDSNTMSFVATKRIKGKSTIFFSIPQWMLFHRRNPNYSLIDDLLAQTIMHELFHIEHHKLNGVSQKEIVRGERAAWVYTCRSIVKPQRAAGRYAHLALRDTAFLDNCNALRTFGEHSRQWNALFSVYRAP